MKRAVLIAAALLAIALAAYLVLRRDAEPDATRVELGGYPDDIDMARMHRLKYAAIVALLDPNLPHERVLLEREQRLAAKAGLRVIAIAMRDANDTRAADAAAEAIRTTPGRIYLHAYLGVHRVRPVAERIGYPLPKPESGVDLDRVARARDLVRLRQYGGALDLLEDVSDPGAATWQLRGDANLGLGIVDEAESAYRIAILAEPRNAAALRGLGYTYMRQNQIDMAREALSRSLAIDPNDQEARDVLSRF
ncbi:MAG TPA: tetratricopeptide repeat protein [Thermoanaerobaculia bacterium]|jgi:tetratricopeptide (TPR) repeat protein